MNEARSRAWKRLEKVSVDIERYRGIGMPKLLGEADHIDARGNVGAGVGVPQVVEAERRLSRRVELGTLLRLRQPAT